MNLLKFLRERIWPVAGNSAECKDLKLESFPYASSFVPYYTNGRILLPHEFSSPAVVVPIDGEYVVAAPLPRNPIVYFVDKFEEMMPKFNDHLSRSLEISMGDVPRFDVDGITPFSPNPFFSITDARFLSYFINEYKPKKYFEIGSGNSTRFARRAIKNSYTDCEIVCVDPNPRSNVDGIADRVIPKSFLDVNLEEFISLEANDILFLDGSHLVFHGTDTTRFFMEVLPIVKPGVLIHIHDIFIPYEYPERCDKLFWNEQYLVAAFLMMNSSFEVVMPVQYMYSKGLCEEGCSFWFRRIL